MSVKSFLLYFTLLWYKVNTLYFDLYLTLFHLIVAIQCSGFCLLVVGRCKCYLTSSKPHQVKVIAGNTIKVLSPVKGHHNIPPTTGSSQQVMCHALTPRMIQPSHVVFGPIFLAFFHYSLKSYKLYLLRRPCFPSIISNLGIFLERMNITHF